MWPFFSSVNLISWRLSVYIVSRFVEPCSSHTFSISKQVSQHIRESTIRNSMKTRHILQHTPDTSMVFSPHFILSFQMFGHIKVICLLWLFTIQSMNFTHLYFACICKVSVMLHFVALIYRISIPSNFITFWGLHFCCFLCLGT